MSLYALIGLMAPVLFLYAYAMVSLGRWPSTAMKFHVLNLLGAVFILISLLEQWNLSVFVLEICWSSISLYGMWKALRASSSH
jgi:hypothetical protein